MYASKLQHIFERKFCKGAKEHPYRTYASITVYQV